MTETEKLELLTKIVTITGKSNLKESDLDFLPSNYKLMHIAQNTECGDYKYYSLAIYNSEEKEIIISNYGTHLNFTKGFTTTLADIYADIQLGLKMIPDKFSSTEKFAEQIKDLLGPEFNNTKITCVGHSLGGFLATLNSIKFKAMGFSDVKAITFDSPGAKEVGESLAQKLAFKGDINEGVKNYVTKYNFVNSTNENLGEVYFTPRLEQEMPGSQKNAGIFSSMMDFFWRITGLKALESSVEDHMIWNFTDFFDISSALKPNNAALLKVKSWNKDLVLLEDSSNSPENFHSSKNDSANGFQYIVESNEKELDLVHIIALDHTDIMNYYL